MSLGVCLYEKRQNPAKRIIIEDEFGGTQSFYVENWKYDLPTVKSVVLLFKAYIEHDLDTMAEEASIDKHLWTPARIDITQASELIEPLTKGISLLESDPERFKAFNTENGTYEDFVPLIKQYLEACKKYPTAFVVAEL